MKSYVVAALGCIYIFVLGALIAGKLGGHLHWSWWLVLLPVWVPIAIVVIGALIMIIGFSDAAARGENPFE